MTALHTFRAMYSTTALMVLLGEASREGRVRLVDGLAHAVVEWPLGVRLLFLLRSLLGSRAVADRSPVGLITADIKELAAFFSSVRFSHVNRLSNVAAHILARSCESSSDTIFHVTPDCIREALSLDYT